jgi:hypothetical protein
MTDVVHWRHEPCGVQEKHGPHAYTHKGDARVCEGVTEWQALAFAIERLGFQLRAMLMPALYRLNEELVRLHRALNKADDDA